MSGFGKRGVASPTTMRRTVEQKPSNTDVRGSKGRGEDYVSPESTRAVMKLLSSAGAGVVALGALIFAADYYEWFEPGDQPAAMIVTTMSGDNPQTMKGRTYQIITTEFPKCRASAREAVGLDANERRPGRVANADDWVKAGNPNRPKPPGIERWNKVIDAENECYVTKIAPAMCDAYARWYISMSITSYVGDILNNDFHRFPAKTTVTAGMIEQAMPEGMKKAIRSFHRQGLLTLVDLAQHRNEQSVSDLFRRLTAGATVAPFACPDPSASARETAKMSPQI